MKDPCPLVTRATHTLKYFDARKRPKTDPQMTVGRVVVQLQVTKGVRAQCPFNHRPVNGLESPADDRAGWQPDGATGLAGPRLFRQVRVPNSQDIFCIIACIPCKNFCMPLPRWQGFAMHSAC